MSRYWILWNEKTFLYFYSGKKQLHNNTLGILSSTLLIKKVRISTIVGPLANSAWIESSPSARHFSWTHHYEIMWESSSWSRFDAERQIVHSNNNCLTVAYDCIDLFCTINYGRVALSLKSHRITWKYNICLVILITPRSIRHYAIMS